MRIRGRGWVLALDAMGVLYRSGDDVEELLIPFVMNHFGAGDKAIIQRLYHRASLGEITACEFWKTLAISPTLEDVYLAQHKLVDGSTEFLETAHGIFDAVFCASNDVSEWSIKLRRRFQLEKLIDHWLISGDLGLRKPDSAFFYQLIAAANVDPAKIFFVDDRIANVIAAAKEGLHAVLFGTPGSVYGIPAVRSYDALKRYLGAMTCTRNDDAETVTWRRLEQGAEYGAEDVTSITKLLHDAYAPLGAAGMNYSAVDQDEQETLMRLRRGVVLIGVIHDEIVATGTVYLEPIRGISVTYQARDTAHFGQFAVAPTLQGTGIGGDLLSRLEAIARNAGKMFIACDTAVPAQKLVRYYRRGGYEVIERVQWPGKTYQSEVLRKRLI